MLLDLQDTTDEDSLWLVHERGFTLGHLIEAKADGRVKIRVMDMEMTVDVADVDKANPAELDRVKNLFRFQSSRIGLSMPHLKF